MARKRKGEEPKKENRPEGYDVLIGFVKKFIFVNGAPEEMKGHPQEGRIYRIIKDPKGYRLHIGKENIDYDLDGIYLDDTLKGVRFSFDFDIVVVTPKNFLSLGLIAEDLEKVSQWLETDNADMWERLTNEVEGRATVIRKLGDILSMIDGAEELKPTRKKQIPIEEPGEISFQSDSEDDAVRLANSLNTISEKDPEAFMALLDVLEYLASTYSDKYESGEIPNLSKTIVTQSPTLGKGANVFTMMKYIQRYATKGFEKSENIRDIYKTVHYALFEVQRRKHQSK